PVLRDERLEPRRGVAGRTRRADEETVQLLLPPRGKERRALHAPHLRADADRAEIPGDGLAERGVGWERRQVACVEAVGIPGVDEELLRALRIVGGRRDLQRELEGRRDERAGFLAETQ